MAPNSSKGVDGNTPVAAKELIIPCLTKLEDLIKAHPELDISSNDGIRLRTRVQATPNGSNESKSTVDNRLENSRNSRNNHSAKTVSSRPARPQRGRQKATNVKSNGQSTSNAKQKTNGIVRSRQFTDASEAIKKSDESFSCAKPGTVGFAQALTNPTGRTRKAQENLQIQTNSIVDQTIVYSLKEICHRLGLDEIPSDARKICKDFRIIVCDLELNLPSFDDEGDSKPEDARLIEIDDE